MKPILGQIVRLAKSIQLRPLERQTHPSVMFMASKLKPLGVAGGIGLTWWYGSDTSRAIDSVTSFLMKDSNMFRHCDPESIAEVIQETMQSICMDREIFDTDSVLLAKENTLFGCRGKSIPEFAALILKSIETRLRELICSRCTIYAVPRVKSTTFALESGSFLVVSKNDTTAWQALVRKGYQFDGWSPSRPFLNGMKDQPLTPPGNFDCILVAEEYGTKRSSRFNSILRFRKFLATLFCVASQSAAYPIGKSIANPYRFCMQFPHESAPHDGITRCDSPALLPYFSSDVLLDHSAVTAIEDWYAASERCSEPARQRIEKGAHFLNRAMNSDDIEAYVNYFISLDALFGERGNVESSILSGVRSLGVDPKLAEKVPWLFDLRNELVHGGSRHISEWPKYAKYARHFQTKPFDDIRLLAQVALLNVPCVLK